MKKTRINGSRKNRTNQIVFGAAEVQVEPVNAVEVQSELILEDEVQTVEAQNEHADEAHVLDDEVPTAEVHVEVQNEHSEPDCAGEEVQALGRCVGRPDGNGKKRKSLNLLCGVIPEVEKKSSGKKR